MVEINCSNIRIENVSMKYEQFVGSSALYKMLVDFVVEGAYIRTLCNSCVGLMTSVLL